MTELLACLQLGSLLWIVCGLGLLLWVAWWAVAWLRDWYEAVAASEEGEEDE
jgi:hypothetical protein